jgi:hypothetical protein
VIKLLQSFALPLGHVAGREGIIAAAPAPDKALRGPTKVDTISRMTDEKLPHDEPNTPDDAPESAPDVPEADAPAGPVKAGEAPADKPAPEPVDPLLPGVDPLFESDFDVEAALNALLAANAAPPAEEEAAEDEAEEADPRASYRAAIPAQYEQVAYVPRLAMPRGETLKRGSPGSLAAALSLIAIGGWLTLTLSSGGDVPAIQLWAAAGAGVVLTLLAHWLGTGRWGRGVLFTALLILALAGLGAAFFVLNLIDFPRAWPLVLTGIGVASLLTAVLGRPFGRSLFTSSLMLIIAGLAGTVVSSGVLDAGFVAAASAYWPVALGAVLVLWLLPRLARRRG